MSDLISRIELIDYFYYGIDDKPIIDEISDRKIIDIIKNQPTAYSVDNVVAELEEATQCIKIDGKPTNLKAIHPTQAIEIVKRCGVSDNVCKWTKIDEEGYKNCKCNYDETIPDFFKYCPYCGKKIKVVEWMSITQIGF